MAGFECCPTSFRACGCRLVTAGLLMIASAAYAGDVVWSTPAAQTAEQDFNIPLGSLGPALRQLAGETQFDLVYDASVTENAGTMGVDGRYAPMLALQILLACTGVHYHFIDANTVVLKRIIAAVPVAFRGENGLASLRTPMREHRHQPGKGQY